MYSDRLSSSLTKFTARQEGYGLVFEKSFIIILFEWGKPVITLWHGILFFLRNNIILFSSDSGLDVVIISFESLDFNKKSDRYKRFASIGIYCQGGFWNLLEFFTKTPSKSQKIVFTLFE